MNNLVEIKYSPEDEVYKLHKDQIVKGKIETIKLIIKFDVTTAIYEVRIKGRKLPINCKEDEIAYDMDNLFENLRNRVLE